MAWKTKKYHLTGVSPLIQHSGRTADPSNEFAKSLKRVSSKRKKVDADYELMSEIEFKAGLYMNEEGPVLPPDNIETMIIEGARKDREGKVATSGMFVEKAARLEYDGPRTDAELWADKRFVFTKLVRVQRARVVRTRPVFHNWSATIEVNYEDTLVNETQLDRWVATAGMQIGIGDWRPRYGRFDVS
jgi:hypothetical protein